MIQLAPPKQFHFLRIVEEKWQTGVPWSGQCWQDHTTAHAQG